jgi:hypothetical protein
MKLMQMAMLLLKYRYTQMAISHPVTHHLYACPSLLTALSQTLLLARKDLHLQKTTVVYVRIIRHVATSTAQQYLMLPTLPFVSTVFTV